MNADALLHWLLRTSLEASLLILAVLGLRLMLGTRLSPAWRIGLWLLVGTKLMLPAFIPAGFGLGAWFQQDEAARMSEASVTQFVSAADDVMTKNTGVPQMVSEASGGVVETERLISGYHLAAGLWMAGAMIVLAAALYRQRRFNLDLSQRPAGTAPLLRALVASLCQKAGIQQNVRIVLMPAGTTPAVVGIARPSILLPEDWETRFDERSLRHVLLHELLHVKQHDLIWNWAAIAVQALHWFNPLVWFVVSRFQADRELRCDAGALALLSPTERLDYGHTLLRIQETFFAPPAMAGLAPCVRNHPTLHQRIHMIAHPTARQPVIQMLLVLTLSALVCYSFTTARAVEKEVPAKERSREGARTPEAEKPKTGAGEESTPSRTKKTGTGEGDGGTKKPGMRDGEGGTKKTGARDGDGGTKKTGMRDGEGGTKKTGTGDGEGGTKKTGMREGEGGTKKTGMREGEGGKKAGTREGEGSKKTAASEGDGSTNSSETLTLRVIKNGEAVMVGDEEVSMSRLRGHLSTFLPDHAGAKVVVTGDDNIPLSALHNTVDAVRDNGNKKVGIKVE
jgi:beta-lactamase regulating signal transducer with metallopeptidase domain